MNLNRSAFINFQQTDCRRKFDKLFSRNLSSFLLHLRKVPTSFKRGLQAQRPPLPIDFSQDHCLTKQCTLLVLIDFCLV